MIAVLLGLLLGQCFQIRRQRTSYNDLSLQYSELSGEYDQQKTSYNELTQQYIVLSEEHDLLKERCVALEQEALDAQGRAESAERALEAIRQPGISPEPTPEPTEQPGTNAVVQENPVNE